MSVEGTVTSPEVVSQEVKPEVTAEVKPEVTKVPEEAVSSKLAAIAKRDKAALMAMRAAKAKEAEIEARELKLKEQEAKYSQKPANPIEALMRAGFSYKDATDYVLNGEKISPELEVKKVRSELDEYKASQAEERRIADEKALQDTRQQQQEALDGFKGQINDFIEAHAEEYELISLHESQDLVFATINEHLKKTKEAGKPKILSIKEASDLVEQYLYEKIEESVNKAKRFKSKFTPITEEKKENTSASKTLSNSMTSSAASTLPARTEQDRIKRALAALEKTG